MRRVLPGMMMALALCVSLSALAFEIPSASAKALGITKGKRFSTGLVFVDGKFIPPPYVVERWGNGIRINRVPVTGQVIDWNEFLKTQSGVKVSKTESAPAEAAPAPAAPAPAPEPAPAPAAADDDEEDDSSLDDLFDDDPKPKKTAKKDAKKPATTVVKRAPPPPPKPKVTVTYSLEGEFEKNDAVKAMVVKINAVRTEIDRLLRAGGFICFGERYSRVTGDERTAKKILDQLPEIQRGAESVQDFTLRVRSAGLVYFNEMICEELFRNRVDYRKLQEHREKVRRAAELDGVINSVGTPLF